MESEKVSVLVVDDDVDILETLSDVLSGKGYLVETAKTGGEAIEKVKGGGFNIALLDIKLPDMSGVEVLKGLRGREITTLGIMITGYASIENAIASLNEGAFAYLQKPLDMGQVLEVVKRAVETQRELKAATEKSVVEFIKRRAEQLKMECKLP